MPRRAWPGFGRGGLRSRDDAAVALRRRGKACRATAMAGGVPVRGGARPDYSAASAMSPVVEKWLNMPLKRLRSGGR